MSSPQNLSRRDLFQVIGVSIALAQQAHGAIAEAKSLAGGPGYKPACFTRHHFQTLRLLADMIIPADEHSPGAADAGAAEFIDFLSSRNPDMAAIFNGGLAWLDHYMQKKYAADFLSARPAQRTELLDKLAWKKNSTAETAPGEPFWVWLRNMVVDAYYTSPVGVKDLGYMGNAAMSQFSVPAEAVTYALKRSPFANEG
jgi:gluconate 2-dehydrogenase gamma chain